MFSRRTGWTRDLNALTRRLESLRSEGRPLVDLTVTNPSAVGLEFPFQSIAAALTSREAAWDWCAARGCALVSDEVFQDYARPAARPNRVVRAASPEARALTFSLSGLSKIAALPQLKLGWIAVAGPPALRDEALARLELIADSYLSVNTPVQVALPEILRIAPAVQEAIRHRVRHN